MKILSSSGKGNFIIEKESKKILELKYKNWFSSSANTEFEDNKIEIRPKNIWNSKFDIYKNNLDKGDIIFNWKGNIIIRLSDEKNTEKSFLLRARGFWNQQFELTDEQDNLIFVLKPSMNWKKLSYNYDIQNLSNTYEEITLVELAIYCGFGANLYMTMAEAGAV